MQKFARLFNVPQRRIKLSSVVDWLFQPLDKSRAAMGDVLTPVVQDGDDDDSEPRVFCLGPAVSQCFRWSLSQYLIYYRTRCLYHVENLMTLSLDHQRSLNGYAGDSFVNECQLNAKFYQRLSPNFYGVNFPYHMLELMENLLCRLSCDESHLRDSRSPCSTFLKNMVLGPLG